MRTYLIVIIGLLVLGSGFVTGSTRAQEQPGPVDDEIIKQVRQVDAAFGKLKGLTTEKKEKEGQKPSQENVLPRKTGKIYIIHIMHIEPPTPKNRNQFNEIKNGL
ncbi:MAG: hypothetical protein ACE5HX_19150, partial [bacterium]